MEIVNIKIVSNHNISETDEIVESLCKSHIIVHALISESKSYTHICGQFKKMDCYVIDACMDKKDLDNLNLMIKNDVKLNLIAVNDYVNTTNEFIEWFNLSR